MDTLMRAVGAVLVAASILFIILCLIGWALEQLDRLGESLLDIGDSEPDEEGYVDWLERTWHEQGSRVPRVWNRGDV